MSTVFYGNTESANQSEKSFRANETETRERESECKLRLLKYKVSPYDPSLARGEN